MPRGTEPGRAVAGVAYASAAYLTWGLFPLYFRALAPIPAPEILAQRIAWSAVFLVLLVTARRRWPEAAAQLRTPWTLARLGASATLISTNWLVYIWAVNSEHVLDASLGYFVNPLLSVLLGVVFLRETLSRAQRIALALAAAGVVALGIRAGHVPWVALFLALTFGLYGLIRKGVAVDATVGLLGEMAVLAPVAVGYLLFLSATRASHFGAEGPRGALLAASGIVTAVPLIWFAIGVRRLRLATIGVLQYLNPTVQFGIAVFAFREPLTRAHAIGFACIWAGLAVYTAEAVAIGRRARQLARTV